MKIALIQPSSISAEELKAGYEKIYKDIYSWKNIFRRMPRHQKAGYLLFNIFYRKYGHLTEKICQAIGYQNIGRLCENIACHFYPSFSILSSAISQQKDIVVLSHA